MTFCPMFPPRTKILESLLVQLYIVHYSCTLYITVFERAENGNAVLCNYIDFAVIFQKHLQYKFYNTLIAGRAGPKNFFYGPGRKFRPG